MGRLTHTGTPEGRGLRAPALSCTRSLHSFSRHFHHDKVHLTLGLPRPLSQITLTSKYSCVCTNVVYVTFNSSCPPACATLASMCIVNMYAGPRHNIELNVKCGLFR